jgi:hypothetical protein
MAARWWEEFDERIITPLSPKVSDLNVIDFPLPDTYDNYNPDSTRTTIQPATETPSTTAVP